jgi:MerR family transcriptional regulator/heat shock protein HspR
MTLIKIYYENSDEMYPLSSLEYSPDFIKTLEEMGVITLKHDYISSVELKKLKRLLRLRSLLGVNIAGAAIILDLLDRIEALEAENQALKWR